MSFDNSGVHSTTSLHIVCWASLALVYVIIRSIALTANNTKEASSRLEVLEIDDQNEMNITLTRLVNSVDNLSKKVKKLDQRVVELLRQNKASSSHYQEPISQPQIAQIPASKKFESQPISNSKYAEFKFDSRPKELLYIAGNIQN